MVAKKEPNDAPASLGAQGREGTQKVISPGLVSILMPVRDEAEFLRAALDSITPPPGMRLELLLIDDGSRDDTRLLAETFAAQCDFPVRILSSEGKGKAAAFNLAYAEAQGEHFILLAGDDILRSEALEARIRAIEGSVPRLAQCRYRTFSGTDPAQGSGAEYPRNIHHDHVAGGAASFNRAFASLYFPIPVSLVNEDTWMRAVKIAHQIPLIFVDQLGLHYRIHGGNSVGPRRSFAQIDQGLRRRHEAFSLAVTHLAAVAKPEGLARLLVLQRAEALRAQGKWWMLLVMPGLPSGDRITMLANSTPWIYHAKTKLVPRLKDLLRRLRAGRGNS